jgi:hypothetical protein
MGLITAHLAATWFMVGLIWVIQIVHYPLFAAVDSGSFVTYERSHTTRMGRLLAIPALTEIVTAALLALDPPEGVAAWSAWLAGSLLAAIWVVTLLVQVPLHKRLSTGSDPESLRRLVRSNWARTVLWTFRGVLAAALFV